MSLIYVSNAYTGWNSATYLYREFWHPQRSLPRPFPVHWYPLPPFVFLTIALWTLCYVIVSNTEDALYGLLIFSLGGAAYLPVLWLQRRTAGEGA